MKVLVCLMFLNNAFGTPDLRLIIQGAMRLAIHCNLHSIPSPSVDKYPESVLPPPANDLEVRDRMVAFWHAFTMDRGARISGVGNVVASDDVRTFERQQCSHSNLFILRQIIRTVFPQSLNNRLSVGLKRSVRHCLPLKFRFEGRNS
jgi:hypothetical protein